jgi:ADP-ribose pyrophosphatase YjhB (NUDIX family)
LTDASNDLTALIREAEQHIGNPIDGLPEQLFLFVSRNTPLVNVDLLIRDDCARTLLTWRSDQFYGPGWHVPGGIIRYKETAGNRIRIVAQSELGATVEFDSSPNFDQESFDTYRRERGHFISLLYRCRLTSELDPHRQFTEGTPSPNQWKWHKSPPSNLLREQRAYARFME